MTIEQRVGMLREAFDMLEKRIGHVERDIAHLLSERIQCTPGKIESIKEPMTFGDRAAIAEIYMDSEKDPQTQATVERLKKEAHKAS